MQNYLFEGIIRSHEVDVELACVAALLLSTLQLEDTSEARKRTWVLASTFTNRIELIGFLTFVHVHSLEADFLNRLLADSLFDICEQFCDAISPIYFYGRNIVSGIWDNPLNVSRAHLETAAIALYFCSIVAPAVTGPWVNLAILHAYQIGPGPYRYTQITDNRDHVAVGVRAVEDFLNKHGHVIDAETKQVSELGLSELIKIDDQFRSLAAQCLETGVVRIE